MAEWKKVIVSGSNASLNHISASDGAFSNASSASISCSGNWFGDLPSTEDQTYVVVYDTATGEMKFRELSSFPGIGG